MAPSCVQPHLEEPAFVVDNQVLTVTQVLHNICRGSSAWATTTKLAILTVTRVEHSLENIPRLQETQVQQEVYLTWVSVDWHLKLYSPVSMPGIRVVLNILSIWVEHIGTVPKALSWMKDRTLYLEICCLLSDTYVRCVCTGYTENVEKWLKPYRCMFTTL